MAYGLYLLMEKSYKFRMRFSCPMGSFSCEGHRAVGLVEPSSATTGFGVSPFQLPGELFDPFVSAAGPLVLPLVRGHVSGRGLDSSVSRWCKAGGAGSLFIFS